MYESNAIGLDIWVVVYLVIAFYCKQTFAIMCIDSWLMHLWMRPFVKTFWYFKWGHMVLKFGIHLRRKFKRVYCFFFFFPCGRGVWLKSVSPNDKPTLITSLKSYNAKLTDRQILIDEEISRRKKELTTNFHNLTICPSNYVCCNIWK